MARVFQSYRLGGAISRTGPINTPANVRAIIAASAPAAAASARPSPVQMPTSASSEPIFVGPTVQAPLPRPLLQASPSASVIVPRSDRGPGAQKYAPPVIQGSDPCTGVKCPAGLTCQDGICQDLSCLGVVCPAGQLCQSGLCVGVVPEVGTTGPQTFVAPSVDPSAKVPQQPTFTLRAPDPARAAAQKQAQAQADQVQQQQAQQQLVQQQQAQAAAAAKAQADAAAAAQAQAQAAAAAQSQDRQTAQENAVYQQQTQGGGSTLPSDPAAGNGPGTGTSTPLTPAASQGQGQPPVLLIGGAVVGFFVGGPIGALLGGAAGAFFGNQQQPVAPVAGYGRFSRIARYR